MTSSVNSHLSATLSLPHNYLTYRARIEGISRTDIYSLISVVEDWVSGGASINVTGVVMTVDSECSVAITSLSDGECSPTQPPATSTTTTTIAAKSSMHTTYAALSGGIVALIFTITVTCTVVILMVKRHRKSGSITTTTNTAYPTVKLERQDDHEYEVIDLSARLANPYNINNEQVNKTSTHPSHQALPALLLSCGNVSMARKREVEGVYANIPGVQ